MKEQVFMITDDVKRQRLIRRIERSEIRDAAGQPLMVVVKRYRRRRSLNQNALYWAWVTILADHVGQSKDDMHDDLRQAFLPLKEHANRATGEITHRLTSTTKLDKVQMAEYMGKIEALARTHFDVILPTPDDPESWEAYEQHQAAA